MASEIEYIIVDHFQIKKIQYNKPKIRFVLQDCWIGLYWKTRCIKFHMSNRNYDVAYERTYYLCLIPCFPIIWTRIIEKKKNEKK